MAPATASLPWHLPPMSPFRRPQPPFMSTSDDSSNNPGTPNRTRSPPSFTIGGWQLPCRRAAQPVRYLHIHAPAGRAIGTEHTRPVRRDSFRNGI
jgi:hypothetical protein